jgi:hypothetical protein
MTDAHEVEPWPRRAQPEAQLTAASTRASVLETISYIETLTTELSNKIWQKISLLPRD